MHIYGAESISQDPGERIYRLIPRVWMQWRVKTCFRFSPVASFLKINFRGKAVLGTGNVIILFCWLQPPAPHVGTMAAAVPALTFKSSGKEEPIRSLPAFSLIGFLGQCVPITKSVFVTVQWSAQVWLCAPPTHCSWNPSRNVEALRRGVIESQVKIIGSCQEVSGLLVTVTVQNDSRRP